MMSGPVLNYAPAEEFNAGRFVARYFQTLAVIAAAWNLVHIVFFNTFYFDLSILIWLWIAHHLKRQNPRARKRTIALCAYGVALCFVITFVAVVWGTKGISLHFGLRLKNPPVWATVLVCDTIGAVFGVPLFVLLSKSARRQFSNRPSGTGAV
jgi:hypothetical protein